MKRWQRNHTNMTLQKERDKEMSKGQVFSPEETSIEERKVIIF